MNPATLSDVTAPLISTRRLLSLIASIEAAASRPLTPASVAALRRHWGGDVAAVILAIAAEQSRAVDKLGPGTWMVTGKSIQQATDRVVAAYKAALFGDQVVFDLCGGVGGDALELARRGPLVTIDCDPQMSAMAGANLHRVLRQPATVASFRASAVAICADATRYATPRDAAIHIDPDRRPNRETRVVRPGDYLPTLNQVRTLVDGGRPAIIKLAPAANLDTDDVGVTLSEHHHRQWISLDMSVREQSLLCGDCISTAGVLPGGRSAVRVRRDGTDERFSIDRIDSDRLRELDRSLASCDRPPRIVVDFDPAVRAAGLSAALAHARGLIALGDLSGFFGCDQLPTDCSLLQCFETVWSGRADLKSIRKVVRQHSWWVDSVKVRGPGQDPAQWIKTLRAEATRPTLAPDFGKRDEAFEASNKVTLLIGRHHQGVYAVIARRCVVADAS